MNRSATPVTAVIITHNEARNIVRCLKSLAALQCEVVVVDSGSTDSTVQLCKKAGAHVIAANWMGFAQNKNLGIQHASNEWILSIDADEALSPELTENLMDILNNTPRGVYSFNRLTNYCGTWVRHGGWYPDTKQRLFHRDEARWVGEHVHETLQVDAEVPITHLRGDLYHYSYYSHAEHRQKADRYSVLRAREMLAEGRSTYPFQPVLAAIGRFVAMYFLKLGILDGAAGWHIARISAASNFVKYKTLRELKHQARGST